MSIVNKPFELERRDLLNDLIKRLNQSWLPYSTRSELVGLIKRDLDMNVLKQQKIDEEEYNEKLREEEEENVNNQGDIQPVDVGKQSN